MEYQGFGQIPQHFKTRRKYQSGTDGFKFKTDESAVCKTAESFKDKSEDRTLQRQYGFDGRRLDAACFGQFSNSFHVAVGRKFSSKSFKFRRDNSAFDERDRNHLQGLSNNEYPEEISGGISEQGVENLKKFVEAGGKLICFDDSCEFVIKRFNLPVKNALDGLKRSEFYNPGSVVKLEVDKNSPLAKNLPEETAAYFTNSSAFEITDKSKVKSVAKYAEKDSLLSGWTLGEKYMNGKTALAETVYGKGKIILFAFRPQHRGQTWATFPFIFNALEK